MVLPYKQVARTQCDASLTSGDRGIPDATSTTPPSLDDLSSNSFTCSDAGSTNGLFQRRMICWGNDYLQLREKLRELESLRLRPFSSSWRDTSQGCSQSRQRDLGHRPHCTRAVAMQGDLWVHSLPKRLSHSGHSPSRRRHILSRPDIVAERGSLLYKVDPA